MRQLTEEEILLMHQMLIDEFGGEEGVRDRGLLDSAIKAPFQSFATIDVYPTIEEKGAHLCYGIIMNHPFVDGNKRIGVHAMLVFLAVNHIELKYTQEELYTVILKVAAGKISVDELYRWIVEHENHVYQA